MDFDLVYRLGRVPESQISAELLRLALAKLPADVPDRARRAALHVTVNALCQSTGAPREAVLDDTRLRRWRLEQFLAGLEDETRRRTEAVQSEVERLEAELTHKRAILEAAQNTLGAARAACGVRIAELGEVLHLLAPAERPEHSTLTVAEEEEGPPFTREDAVLRMLTARCSETE